MVRDGVPYDNDNFGSGELTCLSQNLNSVVSKLCDAELLVSEQNCDQNDWFGMILIRSNQQWFPFKLSWCSSYDDVLTMRVWWGRRTKGCPSSPNRFGSSRHTTPAHKSLPVILDEGISIIQRRHSHLVSVLELLIPDNIFWLPSWQLLSNILIEMKHPAISGWLRDNTVSHKLIYHKKKKSPSSFSPSPSTSSL